MSLPFLLGTGSKRIPTRIPYLHPDHEKVLSWHELLGPKTRLRVGLVWAGNPRNGERKAHHVDRLRSLRFDQLVPLLNVPDIDFYSLQLGEEALAQKQAHVLGNKVIDHTTAIKDFSDTAALIENLDLVIGVDTSIAHLVGALGKPFWLLNRFNTCWRWLLGRDDSPWYPSISVFRQTAFGDWGAVIDNATKALRKRVHGQASASKP